MEPKHLVDAIISDVCGLDYSPTHCAEVNPENGLCLDVDSLTAIVEGRVEEYVAESSAALARAEQALAKAEALSDVREAILTCYWFALAAISAADKDGEHGEHEDCPGAVADASIQTARKLFTDYLAAATTTQPPAAASSEGGRCDGCGLPILEEDIRIGDDKHCYHFGCHIAVIADTAADQRAAGSGDDE